MSNIWPNVIKTNFWPFLEIQTNCKISRLESSNESFYLRILFKFITLFLFKFRRFNQRNTGIQCSIQRELMRTVGVVERVFVGRSKAFDSSERLNRHEIGKRKFLLLLFFLLFLYQIFACFAEKDPKTKAFHSTQKRKRSKHCRPSDDRSPLPSGHIWLHGHKSIVVSHARIVHHLSVQQMWLRISEYVELSRGRILLEAQKVSQRRLQIRQVYHCQLRAYLDFLESYSIFSWIIFNFFVYYLKWAENLKMLARDYQELKVQEKLNSMSSGAVIPRSFLVILDDDLVDKCKPGDDITVM